MVISKKPLRHIDKAKRKNFKNGIRELLNQQL